MAAVTLAAPADPIDGHGRAHPVLRTAMRVCHDGIARTPVVGKSYLAAIGALLRGTPDFPLKANLINSITATEWPAYRFDSRKVEVCPGVTIRLVPHPGEFDFAALLKRKLEYEPGVFQVLRERFDRCDAVIEVGANVGVYTAFFAALAAGRRVRVPIYAFEPSRVAFTRLLENLRANAAATVMPFNVAVAGRSGFTAFFEPSRHLTNGSLFRDFASAFASDINETIVTTIGGAEMEWLVAQHTSVLLKVDAEGAEAIVLESLRPLIERKRPEIVVEVLSSQVAALNALRFIRDAYDLFLITDRGTAARSAFEADARYRDYLLIPSTDRRAEL